MATMLVTEDVEPTTTEKLLDQKFWFAESRCEVEEEVLSCTGFIPLNRKRLVFVIPVRRMP